MHSQFLFGVEIVSRENAKLLGLGVELFDTGLEFDLMMCRSFKFELWM